VGSARRPHEPDKTPVRGAFPSHAAATAAYSGRVNKAVPSLLLLLSCAVLAPLGARADALDESLAQRVRWLASQASQQQQHHAAAQVRVDVRIGQLDPRLKLAACARVEPYLPAGMKLWGPARIGLRCADAGVRWNVFLPITVDVFGPALVAAAPLPAGAVIAATDLETKTVNLSAAPAAALTDEHAVIGRAVTRALSAGDTLRDGDLRARQWFAAGDTVRVVAGGSGWRIHGEGQALNPGIEGQTVRVRTESGRVVSGAAVGERMVEVPL
jgi:flagellar basal body P-ring formation protein FlgA